MRQVLSEGRGGFGFHLEGQKERLKLLSTGFLQRSRLGRTNILQTRGPLDFHMKF